MLKIFFLCLLNFQTIFSFVNLTKYNYNINNEEKPSVCDTLCLCFTRTDYMIDMPIIHVDCSLRSINTFDRNYSLPLLTTALDFSRNKFEILDDNNNGVLSSMTIQILDISRNKIKQIKQGYFKNLPNLLKLDLSENYLSTISEHLFLGLNKLQELDLSFNRLKSLPNRVFSDVRHLKILSLSYNPGLGQFLFDNNLFNQTGMCLTNNLKVLRIENVTLTKFPKAIVDDTDNLTELYMAENPIQELTISMPSTLEVLDLSGTKITKLSSQLLTCPRLKSLYLNRAYNLTKIDSYAFFFLDRIEVISLENCIALSSFNELAFGYEKISETFPDHTLRKLSLARSNVTTLNKTLIHFFKRISKVDLDGNPWKCDCDLEWIRELDINLESQYLRCNAPTIFKFRTFSNVTGRTCHLNKRVSILNIIFVIIFIIILILASVIIWNGPFGKDSKVQFSGRMGPQSPYYSHITIDPNHAELI